MTDHDPKLDSATPAPPNGDGRLANKRRRRRRYDQLAARVSEIASEEGGLGEAPIDSGLWPTAGLSTPELEFLGRALDRTAPKK
jgi:hypothetical protein